MIHAERIPWAVVTSLNLPWAPSIDAAHLLMASVTFFQSETFKLELEQPRRHHPKPNASENLQLFDFELLPEQMAAINVLDGSDPLDALSKTCSNGNGECEAQHIAVSA